MHISLYNRMKRGLSANSRGKPFWKNPKEFSPTVPRTYSDKFRFIYSEKSDNNDIRNEKDGQVQPDR